MGFREAMEEKDDSTKISALGSGAGRTAAGGDSSSLPTQPADGVPDEGALLARLVGRSADEVLSRIANGDPLRLYQRIAGQLRDRYHVLDPDRVFERTLPLVAVGVAHEESGCLRPGWLGERIDMGIRHVLDRDAEDEQAGIAAVSPEKDHGVFVQAFFMAPELARLSSVRLNALSERMRKGFYHLILEGRSLEEVLGMGLWTPDELQEGILRALQAIGLFDETGFQQLLGRKENGS